MAEPNGARQTEYGIVITKGAAAGYWLGCNRKWTDQPDHVRRFDSMTQATIYATLEDMSPDAYEVRPI